MRYSPNRRRDDAVELLRRIFDRIGLDTDFETVFLDPQDPAFSEIIPTTWRELQDRWCLSAERTSVPLYRMTAHGWLESLRVSGQMESDEVRNRCSRLTAALKARVNRNGHSDELASVHDLAANSNTSVDWVYNALNSDLLNEPFPGRNYHVRVDTPLAYIPPTFGQRHLS